ncbi:hypothetical protein QWY31_01430 [Cytophagales bacterium LB-30]|uniref:Tetratricopeptide repeat protein n=1 Tax=Shiella aurantiaca TaxID=3058365 RepID=A0ABT8F167_9BACT|nr:hypothetical protein [Shiella aurantiaca]MDN4164138.1 hypothetical protein [Shiella aurantiaca]
MNKRKIIDLIRHPNRLTEEDISGLEDLLREHPYFQNAHFLLAKAAHLTQYPKKARFTQRAAVFAIDRPFLKHYLSDDFVPQVLEEVVEIAETQVIETAPPVVEQQPEPEFIIKTDAPKDRIVFNNAPEQTNATDSLVAEVKANLKRLQATKDHMQEVEDAMPDAAPIKEKKKAPAKAKKVGKEESKASPKSVKATTKEKKSAKETSSTPKEKVAKAPKVETEKKNAKEKLPQEEQNKIIDQFIEAIPSISKSKAINDDAAPAVDLSETLSYSMEDFVTENLAVIMLKQGKVDIAIDIYKKLIWKFPQKKAYFATQIENLKKQ